MRVLRARKPDIRTSVGLAIYVRQRTENPTALTHPRSMHSQQRYRAEDHVKHNGAADATDRERETGRALLFKEALINEVNHRAKNTLQTAATLLTMQANASSSAEVRRALLDGHARLQLLAEVHASLCIEHNSTQTVFMPRLLQTVCNALARSFGNTCPGVRLEVSCDPISLPADNALAIALLSNEAVTNSYKHAFANQSSGQITLQLHCSSEHAIVLQIADTGTSANLGDSKHGMGLKLMRILSAQVHGALDVSASAGGVGTQITLKIDHATKGDRCPPGMAA